MAKIPSIALIPSGYKATKIYSVLPTDGNGDFTFDRGTSTDQTRVNKDGLIENVDQDVPRLDYLDGGCPSLLLEPSSTNLITYSEDFSDASWFLNNGTLTTNNKLAPNGTLTADKIVFGGSGGGTPFIDNDVDTGSAIASKSFNVSFYIYSDVEFETYIRVRGLGATTEAENITVNVGIGWNRVNVTKSFTGSADGNSIKIALFDLNLNDKTIYVWGAQLEQQSYATSYIPTSGATATRAAETASKTGLSSYINSTEGVLYAEIRALADDLTWRSISISDGSNNVLVELRYRTTTNSINFLIKDSVNPDINKSFTLSDITEFSKFAVKYKNGDVAFWANGTELYSGTDTISFTSNLTDVKFSGGLGTRIFYGKVKELRVYKEALSDLELATLTGFTSFAEMRDYLNYSAE